MEAKKSKRTANSATEILKTAKKVREVVEERDGSIPSNVIHPTSEKINPTEFYLYADLEREAGKFKPSSKDPEQFLKNIKTLDENGTKLVFVIIRMFALKTYEGKMLDLPFKAKVSKVIDGQTFDLDFDLQDLPVLLQRMLFIFCNKHLAAGIPPSWDGLHNPL